MFVLDTNVVSELMRPAPAEKVSSWVNAVSRGDLFITTFTQSEILFGIAKMPNGARRDALAARAGIMFTDRFRHRILPFDSVAAVHYADISATRQKRGRPIAPFDAGIAAIARANAMAVVTRNVRDFEDVGLDVIDPWSE
ncbi:type II toxin-antitoxin system VapC family toxin [Blastochloris viridis]|nr:type II toxin-antitoxin system VapC family toxin [Blastochloris viridis]ALK10943.1 Toxin FitB [Blastochloris viridis]CUU43605.1 putative ribonuclease FitB [Blastochloris viridis]